MKNFWKDVGALLLLAFSLGFLYNLLLGNTPWIRPKDSEGTVPDSILFAENPPAIQDTVLAVRYEQVLKLLNRDDAVFIDARPAEEYHAGHIPNAINIYALEFEAHIPEILQIPQDKKIIVYCGGGTCELSHELAQHLRNFGFPHVFIYTGGWQEWVRKQGNE